MYVFRIFLKFSNFVETIGMKVLYSKLKHLIPELKASPKAVADCLSSIGLLVDGFTEVTIAGKKDTLLSLEVRQNRPDCLGVVGVAREVAGYFGLPFKLPKLKLSNSSKKLSVNIQTHSDIKRVSVIEVAGLNNTLPSPVWLKETVEQLGMNSVSLLVDISNYAMLMTGYPNHIFDAGKVVGGLIWQRVAEDSTFTTLDGTALELTRGKELAISDNLGLLVLASAVGGRRSAISVRTTSVLAEVAVYDGVKMRTDSRSLKVTTEASNRLEKDLSAELSLWALEFLADCLVNLGKGLVVSQVFDYYPASARTKSSSIFLDASLPSRVAGVDITPLESERLLKRIGFTVIRKTTGLQVTAPSWRKDVEDSADLVEEIVRMRGYNSIAPRLPEFVPVPEVTPKRIAMASRVRTLLASFGFDEVLSLPMTSSAENARMAFTDTQEIRTQNAINEEFPALRVGLLGGLLHQQHEYLRKSLGHVQIFEVGKVFSRPSKKYIESERIGLLLQGSEEESAVEVLHSQVEKLLRSLGAVRITYESLGYMPSVANPFSAWVVLVGGKNAGVLYQLKDIPLTGNKMSTNTAYAELMLEDLIDYLEVEHPRPAQELLNKLVVLDTNIQAENREVLDTKLSQAIKQIGKNCVWSWEVIDSFTKGDTTKYTVRVSYQNLKDEEAKNVHTKTFTYPSGG